MKSLIICAAAMILAATAPSDIDVKHFAEADTRVKEAQVLILPEEVIIGIISNPLFTKSDRDKLISELTENVKDTYGFDKVTVSLDVDIFYNIKTAVQLKKDGKNAATKIETVQSLLKKRGKTG